jgi:DNA-binding MarR family transcriptional regulator
MEPLARDKRVKRIVPTAKGEDVHAEFDRIFTKINAQIEQGLSDAEKEQYRATMTKIATNIGADYFFEEDK